MGDDLYSWCVFRDNKPWITGCDRREALWRLNGLRKEENGSVEV